MAMVCMINKTAIEELTQKNLIPIKNLNNSIFINDFQNSTEKSKLFELNIKNLTTQTNEKCGQFPSFLYSKNSQKSKYVKFLFLNNFFEKATFHL